MKAVAEDYKKRSLDELADEAMEIIRRNPGVRCGYIGERLFADAPHHRGTAPFARIAGRVMKKLEREGRAICIIKNGWHGWHPSIANNRNER